MTHAPLRSFCATTAICAVLALGSTAAWAQAVSASVSEAPAISLPAPAPAQQQPIVLPAEAPAATATVQQVPAAVVADEPAPARSTVRRAAVKAPAASAVRTTVPATPPVTPVAAPAPRAIESTPPVAAPPLAQPAVTPPPVSGDPVVASDTSTGLSPAALMAGLLAALGAGAAGYFALRSRRREDRYEDAHDYEEARDAQPGPATEPLMATHEPELPLPAYATAGDPGAEPVPQVVEPTPYPPTPYPIVAQRIGSEELVPDNREDRDALLGQMVSAAPDAENPFTSRKGRMRRAKLILQAREQEQKEAEAQPFDWRLFSSSTSNPAPATPPRVTV